MKHLAIILLFSVSILAQQPQKPEPKPFELSTVEKLKGVPSLKFDPALPPLYFGKWFKRLVRPAIPVYESRECTGTPAAGSKRECVFVTATLQNVRMVTLKFAYDPEQKSFQYLEGTVEPSDPKSKQPTRQVKKLSDLEAIVNPEGNS